MINIKLLWIIIDAGSSKRIKYLLNKFGVKVKLVSNASGTASQSVLSYFGLTETKKEVFQAIISEELSEKILKKVNHEFNLGEIGTGVAFTIPISSSNKYLSDHFQNDNADRGEIKMEKKKSIQHHLIMTIVAEGYLEKVMTSAKKAGSSGGTAIKGRGLNNQKKAKILGFNIEPERDIVLNIVTNDNKTKVMEEITKEVGIKTDGNGICLSLPIEDIVGLK